MKGKRKWGIISLIVFIFILSSLLLFSTLDATEKKSDCDQGMKDQCPPKIEGQTPKCCPNPIIPCPLKQ